MSLEFVSVVRVNGVVIRFMTPCSCFCRFFETVWRTLILTHKKSKHFSAIFIKSALQHHNLTLLTTILNLPYILTSLEVN